MKNDKDLKRITITSTVVPLRGNDIDTDRIIPARHMRSVTFDGLGKHVFEDDRKSHNGKHPFDDKRFAGGQILISNRNFGCGSSREHAPQALARWNKGIRAIIAESFAEIFFGNCLAIGIPCLTASEADLKAMQELAEKKPDTVFTVDVDKKIVSAGAKKWKVNIPDAPRKAFLEGKWSTTEALRAAGDKIERLAKTLPYLNNWK